LGAIGKDDFGEQLRQDMLRRGLQPHFVIHPQLPTGVCAALLCNKNRCLIPSIGAAAKFDPNDLKKCWV
jgi:adenosine kinase